MRFLPALLSREQSNQLIQRIDRSFDGRGFGLFAAEHRETQKLIGFIGLSIPNFKMPFTPAVEIGWRLARECWGLGFASEGARAVLAHGFDSIGLSSIVSFTVAENLRSRRVMERIGMNHDGADDFDHPNFPPGHRLRRHVLYRIESPPLTLETRCASPPAISIT